MVVLINGSMTSHPISLLCVPDAYHTDERLRVLFNDTSIIDPLSVQHSRPINRHLILPGAEFNISLSHAVPRPSIFANLVNSVSHI